MGRVDVEEMRRRDGSETTSSNYDEIERSGIGMDGRILASPCLVQRVADVAADIVERKGCRENECSHDGVSHFWKIPGLRSPVLGRRAREQRSICYNRS